MRKNKEKMSSRNKGKIIVFFVIILILFIEMSVIYNERAAANPINKEDFNDNRKNDNLDADKVSSEADAKKDKEKIDEQRKVEDIKSTDDKTEKKDEIDNANQEVIKDNLKEGKEPVEKVEEEMPVEKKKTAYLTFDDGPSVHSTTTILDILKQYDIKATFFVVGNQAEKNPDILKRIYEEGHAIGNHTYSHNYSYIYSNPSNFILELEITERILKSILGENFETNIIRFPGGSFGAKREPFRNAVVERGYKYIDWNSLNGDAEGHHIPKDKLIERFKSTYNNQQELVVLMHDTDAKETTPEALPYIIEFLRNEGYEFSTF